MYLPNKYTKWYYSIINNVKIQNRQKSLDTYYESHHIIPVCIRGRKGNGGKNDLVLLTLKEHYLVHWLLTKMVQDEYYKMKLYHAFFQMCGRKNIPCFLKEISKRKHALATSYFFRGKPKSKEHNRKNSEACQGRIPWNKGKKYKRNIAPWNKGLKTGPMKQETIDKLVNYRLGKLWWNNGVSALISETPLEGFVRGRLRKPLNSYSHNQEPVSLLGASSP